MSIGANETEWAFSTSSLRQVDSPHFATYATLRRGIGYERECAEWCRWLADQLEGEHQNGLSLPPRKREG